MSEEPDTTQSVDSVYARAGFGFRGPRGTRPAVVVIDFSRGFTEAQFPTGSDLSDQVRAAAELLDAARASGVPCLFTTIAYDRGEETRLAWLRTAPGLAVLAAGTELVDLDPRLERRDDEPLIVKKGASGFFGTDLADQLRVIGVDTVVLCGATTSGCVRASAVDAVQSDFAVLVVRDAVGDRAQGPHEANLFDIDAKYGDVIDVAEAIDYVVSVGGDA
ncbi:MAG: isochorismatase family protein [Gaiellales bacterium]